MKHWLVKDGNIPAWFEDNAKECFGEIEIVSSGNRRLSGIRLFDIISNHFGYFRAAKSVVYRTNDKDIIVCFLDLIGLYIVVLNILTFKKIKVLIINVMINDNSDVITRIKRGLFKYVLSRKVVYSTVNTQSLKDFYESVYKFDMKRSYVLNDSFTKYSYLQNLNHVTKVHDVFVGGVNARDIELMSQVAARMPDVTFNFCVGNTHRISRPSPNVRISGNVSLEEFILNMRISKISWVPIKSNSAAGIIVLLQSGLLSIPVISTKNIVIPDYVSEGIHGLLVEKGDVGASMKAIRKLLNNPEYSDYLAANFFEKIIANYKPETYFKRMYKICLNINENIIHN